jgi:branched-chain amino acid transport system substrate-binding protein
VNKLCGLVMVAAAILVAGCGGGNSDNGAGGSGGGKLKAGQSILLGYVADKTGFMAAAEQPFAQGLQAEVDHINSKGGIAGKVKIKLKSVDCASDPQQCSSVTQQFISDGAKFLIGPCDIDVATPGALLATQAKVGMLSSCAGGPGFRQEGGASAFLNTFSAPVEGRGMAEYANDEGLKKVAIMTSGDLQYTRSISDTAASTTKSLGGKVVSVQSGKLSAPQYRIQATAIARAQPDVVMTSLFIPTFNIFLRNLRAAGYSGPVYGSDGMGNDGVFAVGDAAKDVYTFNHADFGSSAPPQTKEFLSAYQDKWGKPPADALAALGGDAALLVSAAVQKANSSNPKSIRDALENISGVQGATGGAISYAGRKGLPKKDIVLLKTDPATKKFVFVKRFYPKSSG